jgi:hypothetical protein
MYDIERFNTVAVGALGFATEVEDLETGEVYTAPIWGCDDDDAHEIVRDMVFDSVCEALDGSSIEPDGVTYDGVPSWMLYWGVI